MKTRAILFLSALLAVTAGCATLGGPQTAPETKEADIADQLFKLQKDSAQLLDRISDVEKALSHPAPNAACAEAATRTQALERQLRALGEQLAANQRLLDEALSELRTLRRASGASAPARPEGASPAPAPTASTPAPEALAYPNAGPPVLPSPKASAVTPAGQRPATPPAPPAAYQPREEPKADPGIIGPVLPPPPAAAAPAPPSSPAQPQAAGPQESPQELFNRAYADYSRGQYDLALPGFAAALAADPGGPLADDAQYWLGETQYALGRYPEAAVAFDKVISGWPKGDKVAGARLKKGYALFEGKHQAEAMVEFERVIKDFPNSQEARLARDFLRRKGANTPF